MGIEIERKFLVVGRSWESLPGTRFRQGYLSAEPGRTVRVRVAGDVAFLTIKGEPKGEQKLARLEFEYEIPVQDAHTLLDELAQGIVIDKVRRVIDVDGSTWELDEFFGENAGLVVAEIELPSEDAPFVRPAWLGDEVSTDARFANSRLSVTPFAQWPSVDRAAVLSGRAPGVPVV
jgi:CYTH domain-containing protein